ncbi:MAG TPA: hypothetical protein DEH78_20985 [Solibacterales bacterium]|nr:hypothetical protein [Bryobacterales bacterium]
MRKLRLEPQHPFYFRARACMRREAPQIAHCWSFTDGLAAARGPRRHTAILQLNGAPVPAAYYRRWPPDRWIIREAIAGADVRIVCSEFVRGLIAHYYGQDCRVMFPAFDVDEFPKGPGPADGRPVILAIGDFTLRRKGARPLVRAFDLVRRKAPDAVLRLSGRSSDALQRELLESVPAATRERIEFLGLGKPEDVPAQYRAASVMALPSMWEPSGGVLIESWASGTPVVATRHGGLPEFVGEGVGVLFDPRSDSEEVQNVEGLAEALLAGLDLAQRPGIRDACREHAERFSWRTLGPDLERLYEEVCP